MSQKEIFVSIDVEANGPVPGRYSMMAFGAAAFDLESETPRVPIDTFEVPALQVLHVIPQDQLPLPGGGYDHEHSVWPAIEFPATMEWWRTEKNVEAYDRTRMGAVHPNDAMPEFLDWLDNLPGRPILVGYPLPFDYMFLAWYCWVYGGRDKLPFSHSGFDIKTEVFMRQGLPAFVAATKRRFRKHWFKGAPKHDHTPLVDAIEQGVVFVNMMAEDPGLPWPGPKEDSA